MSKTSKKQQKRRKDRQTKESKIAVQSQQPVSQNSASKIVNDAPPRRVGLVRYISFFAALLLLFLTYVLIQRLIFTWDFIRPWHDVAPANLVPALGVGFFLFLFTIFDITPIQKWLRRWISSKLRTRMPFWLLVSSIIVFSALLAASFLATPRLWSQFIDKDFLSGENNDYTNAITQIKELETAFRREAHLLEACLWIFRERRRINHDDDRGKPDTVALAKQVNFIQDFETIQPHLNAFRKYALAEAHSLSGDHALVRHVGYEMARHSYSEFLNSPVNTLTGKWKDSANLNIGNTFYYEGKWREAYDAWTAITPSPSREINRTAALFMLKDFSNATLVAENGLRLVNASKGNSNSRNAVVGNYMMALMATNGFHVAAEIFEEHLTRKGNLADSDLEATYLLTFLLRGNLDEFSEKLEGKNQIKPSTRNLLQGLYHLKMGNRKEAVTRFRNAMGKDAAGALPEADVLNAIRRNFEERGWLLLSPISDLLDVKSPIEHR